MEKPPSRGGGGRLLLVIALLTAIAAGSVAYRVVAAGRSAREPGRPSYHALLAGDETAMEGCRGSEIAGLEGGTGAGGDEVVAAIARDVERIRELEFERVPEAELLSEEELAERVSEAAHGRHGGPRKLRRALALQDRVLTLLGALDPSVDLTEVDGGFLRGIYLDDEETVLVVGSEDHIEPDVRVTLAHEFAHALVDQHVGLEERRARTTDEHLAHSALVEGDATLTDLRFARWALSAFDRWVHGFVTGAYEIVVDPPSRFLREEGEFPYRAGSAFVCFLYLEGGWRAVNRAFESPPQTSAEVLFPRRYLEGVEPVQPGAALLLPRPWRVAVGDTFGAAQLLWLFEAPGDDTSRALAAPLELAAGWGGGELWLYVDGERSALLLSLVQQPGEARLCHAISDWYTAAFPESDVLDGGTTREALVARGDDQYAVLSCAGNQVKLGIGPDLRTARMLVEPA